MKVLALFACLLLVFQNSCPKGSGGQAQELKQFFAGFQNDFEGSSRSFLEHFDSEKIAGYPAFEESVERFFDETKAERRMHFRPVSIAKNADAAPITAEIEIRFVRGGQSETRRTRTIFSLEKQGGSWRIVEIDQGFRALFD